EVTLSARTEIVALALAFGALAAIGAPRSLLGQESTGGNCAACHAVLGDERLSAPAVAFTSDIHAARGLGCVACHGGNANTTGLDGMDPANGFLGKPKGAALLDVCGRCHSDAAFMRQYNPSLRVDQVQEYVSSVHGQRLVQLGDTAVATCSSCHPAHHIRPPSDPESSVHPFRVVQTCGTCHADEQHMSPYGIPVDQREKYLRSVHWEMLSVEGDLSAPTCNDCHGNHGAAPPGVSWVGNVCGQCHSVMAAKFAQSRHAQTFAMLGVPGCTVCHNNHEIVKADDTLLGLDSGAVCARCHSAGDGGGAVAASMRSLIDSLRVQHEEAEAILSQAESAGMEVSQAQFDLDAAHTALVSARAAIHGFDVIAVSAQVQEGLTIATEAHRRGEVALGGLRFRRLGLGVSVTIILALIAGLVLKIRQLESTEATT
ncbi:MAG: cytochrome c3 family protein, partial [Gemmatimonadota bacterium]|nr:cytochrome c3 family protein [Gemmatimonadota bacterium]